MTVLAAVTARLVLVRVIGRTLTTRGSWLEALTGTVLEGNLQASHVRFGKLEGGDRVFGLYLVRSGAAGPDRWLIIMLDQLLDNCLGRPLAKLAEHIVGRCRAAFGAVVLPDVLDVAGLLAAAHLAAGVQLAAVCEAQRVGAHVSLLFGLDETLQGVLLPQLLRRMPTRIVLIVVVVVVL